MLTSRLGSTRPSIAQGWELEIVSMVILGGVSVWGGKGTIPGVLLAAVVLGFVNFGLGLLNVPGIVMSIIVGALLITVVALPVLAERWWGRPARRLSDRNMSHPLIALLDIGKTHAKLSVVDPDIGRPSFAAVGARMPSFKVSSMRELDVEAIQSMVAGRAARGTPSRPHSYHRACRARRRGRAGRSRQSGDRCSRLRRRLLRASERRVSSAARCLPKHVLTGPAARLESRPSAVLPAGSSAELFSRAAHTLLYPQFWAWRLSGVMASEVTSLGCHSDLWLPQ